MCYQSKVHLGVLHETARLPALLKLQLRQHLCTHVLALGPQQGFCGYHYPVGAIPLLVEEGILHCLTSLKRLQAYITSSCLLRCKDRLPKKAMLWMYSPFTDTGCCKYLEHSAGCWDQGMHALTTLLVAAAFLTLMCTWLLEDVGRLKMSSIACWRVARVIRLICTQGVTPVRC